MSPPKGTLAVVGAASAAEVGAYLAMDSALASLAAFGSVVGLGVLHLRTRRAKHRATHANSTPATSGPALPPSPSFPEPIPMTSPAPAPASTPAAPNADAANAPTRRDETATAVAELCARLDELQRELRADDELAPRVEELRLQLAALDGTLEGALERAKLDLAEVLDTLAARQAREHEESARRASALAESCRAIEARVAKAEERLAAQTQRLESSLAENGERASERSREAIARLVRELSGLREEVTRSSLALAEMGSASEPDIHVHAEQARAIAAASESATALARRVGQLHERVDAGLARIDAGQSNVDASVRHAREQLDELARSAASLHHVAERAAENAAATEARIVARVDAVHADLQKLRDDVRKIPTTLPSFPPFPAFPEVDLDLEPALAAIERAEDNLARDLARVRDDLARLAARETPEVDLATPLEAVHGSIAAQLTKLREDVLRLAARAPPAPTIVTAPTPAPAPTDLSPVLDAVARAEERFVASLPEVHGPVAAARDALAAQLRAVRDDVQRLAAREPQAQPLSSPTDLSPVLDAVARAEERFVASLPDVHGPVAAARDALAAQLRAVRDDVHRLAAREPQAQQAPQPTDLSPVLDAVADAEQRVLAALPDVDGPIAAVHDALVAQMRGLREETRRLALRETPVPAPVDLAPILASIGRLEQAIAALPAPPEIDGPLGRLHRHLAGDIRKVRDEVREIAAKETPLPPETDLSPVLDAIVRLEETVWDAQPVLDVDVETPLATWGERLSSELAKLRDDVQRVHRLAARELPEIPAPTPATDLSPVLDAISRLEDTVLDTQPIVDVDVDTPLAAWGDRLQSQLSKLHAEVQRLAAREAPEVVIPAPVEIDLDTPLAQMGDQIATQVRKLREEVRAHALREAPVPPPPTDLTPVLDAVARAESSLASSLVSHLQRIPDARPGVDAVHAEVRGVGSALDRFHAALDRLGAQVQDLTSHVDELAARESESFGRLRATVDELAARETPEPVSDIVVGISRELERLAAREPPAPPDARPAVDALRGEVRSTLARLQATVDELASRETPPPPPAPAPIAIPPFPDARPAVEGLRSELRATLGSLRETVQELAQREPPAPPAPPPPPAPVVIPPFPDARPAVDAVAAEVRSVQAEIHRLQAAVDRLAAREIPEVVIPPFPEIPAFPKIPDFPEIPDARPAVDAVRAEMRATLGRLQATVDALAARETPAPAPIVLPAPPAPVTIPPFPDARPAVESLRALVVQLQQEVTALAAREPPTPAPIVLPAPPAPVTIPPFPDARPAVDAVHADLRGARAEIARLQGAIERLAAVEPTPTPAPAPDARPAVESLRAVVVQLQQELGALAAREPPTTPDARPAIESLRKDLRAELAAGRAELLAAAPDLDPIHAALTRLAEDVDRLAAKEVAIPTFPDARPAVDAVHADVRSARVEIARLQGAMERLAAVETPTPPDARPAIESLRKDLRSEIASTRDELRAAAPDLDPIHRALTRLSEDVERVAAKEIAIPAFPAFPTIPDPTEDVRRLDARVAGVAEGVAALSAQLAEHASREPPAPPAPPAPRIEIDLAPQLAAHLVPFQKKLAAEMASLRDDVASLALQEPDWTPSFAAVEKDAQVIHESIEDVYTAVHQLGREMDARMTALEARILDEVRAIAARLATPPTAPATPPVAPAPATPRPRRSLRAATE